jgi:hypothetical protein
MDDASVAKMTSGCAICEQNRTTGVQAERPRQSSSRAKPRHGHRQIHEKTPNRLFLQFMAMDGQRMASNLLIR